MTNKQKEIKILVNKLEESIGTSFLGFHDNSFDELVYSEYRLKLALRQKWKPSYYIPFVYKQKTIYYKDLDCIVRKPNE